MPSSCSTCASVNDAALHGIPGRRKLAQGDLLSIDCGAVLDGWAADAAISFTIGEPSPFCEAHQAVASVGGLEAPTSGELRYFDHVLTQATDRELTRYRREHVGFVFQFYNLIPSLTARENVSIVTEISKNPMTPEAALSLVGLSDRIEVILLRRDR